MSSNPTQEVIDLNDIDGDTLYTFRAGYPDLTIDYDNIDDSFTKTWEIIFETTHHNVDWKPGDQIYKGIVFGDVNSPTAQVKITKDMTLGFISNNKDFR